MFMFQTIALKCAMWMFNDPGTIKRCYNNKKLLNLNGFHCVHTGHFDKMSNIW